MPKLTIGNTEKNTIIVIAVVVILMFTTYIGERFQPYKTVGNIGSYTLSQIKKSDTQKKVPVKRKIIRISKYTVKKGDTIWSISKKFHANQEALKFANYIGSNSNIKEGQRLTIPRKK